MLNYMKQECGSKESYNIFSIWQKKASPQMATKKYNVLKRKNDSVNFLEEELWNDVNEAIIEKDSYQWMNNGYTPTVIIKMFHTDDNIYLKFKVIEKKVTIRYTQFGSPVWKDSCVEFFFNPFPEQSEEFFNIEINAIGVPLIGVGKINSDTKRYYFNEEELKKVEIIPSIKKAIIGEHGAEYWNIHLKIPKSFFENYYGQKITTQNGIANFYKCGDETEFEHYGAWNRIDNPTPNFHLPKYFGKISFTETDKD